METALYRVSWQTSVRKGLTEGLGNFIQVHNHRALELGHLNEGLGKLKVRRLKGSEGYPEVTGQGEPRRIDAVSRGSGYVEVLHQCRPHGRGEVGSSPWQMHDWHALCQALYKGIEGEDWGELYDAQKEMSGLRGSRSRRRLRKQKPSGK